jgi:hypothetical protein
MNEQLKNYLALTAGFVALAPIADAQIIYVDINPDSVLTGNESFQLDVNHDGTFDYKIKQFSDNHKFYYNSFTGLNDNQVLSFRWSYDWNRFYLPERMNFGDEISSDPPYSKVWRNGGYLVRFRGHQDKYIGLRFKISGDFHNGWARLDVDSSGMFITLKDYAYNVAAGKSIMAGCSKVSLPDENPIKNIRIYSTAGIIRIEAADNEILTGTIRLSDINGRELKSVDVKNEKNIELNTQNLPTGLYIVNILTEKGTLNKKVLVR